MNYAFRSEELHSKSKCIFSVTELLNNLVTATVFLTHRLRGGGGMKEFRSLKLVIALHLCTLIITIEL